MPERVVSTRKDRLSKRASLRRRKGAGHFSGMRKGGAAGCRLKKTCAGPTSSNRALAAQQPHNQKNRMHPEPNEHLTIRIIHTMRMFSRLLMGLFPCQKDRETIPSASSRRLIALTKSASINLRSWRSTAEVSTICASRKQKAFPPERVDPTNRHVTAIFHLNNQRPINCSAKESADP